MKKTESTCMQCERTSKHVRVLLTFKNSMLDGICNECLGDAIAMLAQIERKMRETAKSNIDLKVVNSMKG